MRVMLFWLLLLPALLAAQPRQQIVPLQGKRGLDESGMMLRQALNAWVEAGRAGLPFEWTKLELSEGDGHVFPGGRVLVLLQAGESEARLLVGGDAVDSWQTTFSVGDEKKLGPIEIILVSSSKRANTATLLLRSSERDFLVEGDASKPLVRITGLEEPNRMNIFCPADPRAVQFAAVFLREFKTGETALASSQQAFKEVPPTAPKTTASPPRYTDRVNAFLGEDDLRPHTAVVTLDLSRGDLSRRQEFGSSGSYNSSGSSGNSSSRVSFGQDGRGRVQIGGPNDKWQFNIQGVESSRTDAGNFSTMVRVPLNGSARFRLSSPNGVMIGTLYAEPRGRDVVELSLRSTSGDWSTVGSVSTRVRVRDGQTLKVAGSTSARSSSFSSGAPIVSDIPYAGALAGSEVRTSSSSGYNLFATVRLE